MTRAVDTFSKYFLRKETIYTHDTRRYVRRAYSSDIQIDIKAIQHEQHQLIVSANEYRESIVIIFMSHIHVHVNQKELVNNFTSITYLKSCCRLKQITEVTIYLRCAQCGSHQKQMTL